MAEPSGIQEALRNPGALSPGPARVVVPQADVDKSVEMLDPATGAPLALDPIDAETAFRRRSLGVRATAPVPIADNDGNVTVVPGSGLAAALLAGHHMASPAAAKQSYLEQQYGGALGTVEAGALGFARGATFGVSDQLASMGGSERMIAGSPLTDEDTTRFLKERHEVASGLGAGLGMATQVAATGGLGLGALAERGAMGAGESAIAQGLARQLPGVGGRVAESLGGGLIRRGAGAVARGAGEGVQFAQTDALSEEALGAPPLTAEKYLAQLGEGALWGGVVSGGMWGAGELLGGAGRGVKSLFGRAAEEVEPGAILDAEAVPGAKLPDASPADIEALSTKATGYRAGGLGKAYTKIASAIAGDGEEIISEAGIQNQSAAAKALRQDLVHVEEIRAQAARQTAEHLDSIANGLGDLTDEAKGELKEAQVRRAVSSSPEMDQAASEHAYAQISRVRLAVQEMQANQNQYGNKQFLGNLETLLARHDDTIAAVANVPGPEAQAAKYIALDQAKREIGAYARKVNAVLRNQSDPLKRDQALSVFKRLGDLNSGGGLYQDLRQGLEDENIWGKAGADQRAINDAWTSQIAASKSFQKLVGLTTEVREENFGTPIVRADPEKVGGYIRGLVNPEKDFAHSAFKSYVASTQKLAETIADRYELPAGKAAEVAGVAKSARTMTAALDLMGDRLAKANQLANLVKRETGGGTIGATTEALGLSAVMGPHLGLPLTAAHRLLASPFTSPGKSIMRLAQLEGMVAKFNGRAASAVTDFFARAEAAGEAQAVAKVTSKSAVAAAEAAPADIKQGLRETYAKRAAAITAIQKNPELLQHAIERHVMPLAAAAPNTAKAFVGTALRASTFLASKKPQPQSSDTLFAKEGLPSDSEISKFARYVEAVHDPAGAIDDMRNGRITSEQVEALQAVYPGIYAELRGRVVQALSDHGATGKAFTYQARVQLGLVFGLPAAADMTPEASKHAQATFAATPAPPQGAGSRGGKGAPSPLGKAMTTRTQQIQGEAG